MRSRACLVMPRATGRRWRVSARKSCTVTGSVGSIGERLRHAVTNRSGTLPGTDDARPSSTRSAQAWRRSSDALAGAVAAYHHVGRARATLMATSFEDRLAVPAKGQAIDPTSTGFCADSSRFGNPARTIVSTFFCISRSNLSAVYSPEAMCVMM